MRTCKAHLQWDVNDITKYNFLFLLLSFYELLATKWPLTWIYQFFSLRSKQIHHHASFVHIKIYFHENLMYIASYLQRKFHISQKQKYFFSLLALSHLRNSTINPFKRIKTSISFLPIRLQLNFPTPLLDGMMAPTPYSHLDKHLNIGLLLLIRPILPPP